MPHKSTLPAPPHPPSGLVFVPAYWTLAARSSFAAGEALDAGLFALVGQIVDVFSVFPLGHALVVMPSFVLLAHAMGVANKKCPNLLFFTEVKHLARGLVPQVTHAPLDATRHLVLRPLQFLPATGVFLTACLFFGKLSVPHVALALEAANTTP